MKAAPFRGIRDEVVGDALVLTIDRPEKHNALDRECVVALAELLARADGDASVRGVIITGAGDRAFTAGADLNLVADAVKSGENADAVASWGRELVSCERCSVPVIAAVQGDAYGGGCELLLLCDMVIMESHAGLSFRHAKMGLSPAWGGLTRLIERVGPLAAARLLYTAEKIDAEEALRLGLVNEVVPRGAARVRATALVARIADNPRATVAALKSAFFHVRARARGRALEAELGTFRDLWGGPDHLEAMKAFRGRKKGKR